MERLLHENGMNLIIPAMFLAVWRAQSVVDF